MKRLLPGLPRLSIMTVEVNFIKTDGLDTETKQIRVIGNQGDQDDVYQTLSSTLLAIRETFDDGETGCVPVR